MRCDRSVPILLVYALVALAGCASYVPPKQPSFAFTARAETQSQGDVVVSAVLLDSEESKDVFGTSLPKHQIQPIWLEIDNRGNELYTLMLLGIDRDYFSPSEAAWRSRGIAERRAGQKMQYFYKQHIPAQVAPCSRVSGFVYTNLDPGAKAFTVELLGRSGTQTVEFVLPVPGFKADFSREEVQMLHAEEEFGDVSQDGLRSYLESLPCCVMGGDRETPGDPLNLVIVGEGRHVISTLVRQGWDLTETLTLGNAWRTAMSSLFDFRYRTSPISKLYLFDRPQDGAFQKARRSVDERNHLRLWRAPVNCDGAPVWVGQISRDIGVRFSSRTLVTHKIDPMVDEARFYLAMDLLASRYVAGLAYAEGVDTAPLNAPRHNYTRDPYFTDGLRLVLFLAGHPVASEQVQWLPWERPRDIARSLEQSEN